ncbi:MAG TPA: glutamate--tRNA ligase family protein [Candidatus Limnocylindrales bacterium]
MAVDDGNPLFLPLPSPAARPDPRVLPLAPVTRFAPAPTGDLHLGHLVNALYTWGIARATGGRVVLRIEDHDRQRSRAAFEATLLDDLERLGLVPGEPAIATFRAGPTTFRQSDAGAEYQVALAWLRDSTGTVYACRCSRATYSAYAGQRGRTWHGMGCPGGCREKALPEDEGTSLRVAVGAGSERWLDLLAGPVADEPAASGDLLVRDRHGNWTYPFCVVVDDMRQGIDLVIRGRDLLDATPVQLRLARLLGRETPPLFLHHPLVRRATGQKLSKSEGDTSVRSLLDAGRTPAQLFGLAARLAGLTADTSPIEPSDLWVLFAA